MMLKRRRIKTMMIMIFQDKSGIGGTGSQWLRTKNLMTSARRKWPPPVSG